MIKDRKRGCQKRSLRDKNNGGGGTMINEGEGKRDGGRGRVVEEERRVEAEGKSEKGRGKMEEKLRWGGRVETEGDRAEERR